jgi:hypothetical protein
MASGEKAIPSVMCRFLLTTRPLAGYQGNVAARNRRALPLRRATLFARSHEGATALIAHDFACSHPSGMTPGRCGFSAQGACTPTDVITPSG